MSGFVKLAITDYYSDSNWTTIISKYWMLAERVSDPRVEGWMLFDNPLPTFAMVLVYLSFVMVVGPLWMSTRKPFKLQGVLITYNFFQVLLSSYMFYEHLMSGWWGDYSLSCQPVDYSDNLNASRMLHLCWVYYYSKLTEFADTMFFVLRKKKNQITWLHLYHHSLTPFEAWVLVKFVAGGHGTFSNIINNFVHVVMYGYYMVAAMGPQYHKYLWWKKHLTSLQLIQFFMVLFHSMSAVIYDCGYPKLIASGLVLHSIVFIVLFTNFYIHTYNKNRVLKTSVQDIPNNNNEPLENKKAQLTNGVVGNGHLKPLCTNDNSLNGDVDRCDNKKAMNCMKVSDKIDDYLIINNNEAIMDTTEEEVHHKLSNGHVKNSNVKINGNLQNGYIQKNGYKNGHIPKDLEDKKLQ